MIFGLPPRAPLLSHDGMRTARSLFLLALTAAAPLHATILLTDQFLTGSDPSAGEYAIGAAVGQNPTLLGFSGAVVAVNNTSSNAISGTGLTYTGMDTAGGLLTVSTGMRVGHAMDFSWDQTTTGTYYVGLLMRFNNTVATQYKAFEFNVTGGGDASRALALGQRDTVFGTTNYALLVDGQTLSLGAADTNVNFFVIELNFSTVADGDSVTIYRNPTDLGSEGGNTPVGTLTGLDIGNINQMNFAAFSGGSVSFDELRVGTAWSDVTTVPEPSIAMAFLGGIGLLALRRRVRLH